jgi:hypothetical protein
VTHRGFYLYCAAYLSIYIHINIFFFSSSSLFLSLLISAVFSGMYVCGKSGSQNISAKGSTSIDRTTAVGGIGGGCVSRSRMETDRRQLKASSISPALLFLG